jgi:hypothetical protein
MVVNKALIFCPADAREERRGLGGQHRNHTMQQQSTKSSVMDFALEGTKCSATPPIWILIPTPWNTDDSMFCRRRDTDVATLNCTMQRWMPDDRMLLVHVKLKPDRSSLRGLIPVHSLFVFVTSLTGSSGQHQ